MRFDEMLIKPVKTNDLLLPKTQSRYPDFAVAGRRELVTFYPDTSQSFDDLVSVIATSTGEGLPFMMVHAGFLFHRRTGGTRIYFEDGFLTPPHKHNFVELAYILEGQLHKQIEGKEYVFNRGEFFLLNRGVRHGEYYYRKNSAVVWLRLSSAFFDRAMHYKNIALTVGKELEEFLRRFAMNSSREYYFVRFIPPPSPVHPYGDPSQISSLFEQIFDELTLPRPGSIHIVIGYVERLLSLIPRNCKFSVEWSNRKGTENQLFEKIRCLLEDCYEDVSMRELIAAFGHNADYFNRLIKRHTGMTYSAFHQSIRLERAAFLLKTTEFSVEEIAHKIGYENLSYFYKIFTEKFRVKPHEMRKAYTDKR
jgi:AraC-like DNA-binding protein/mannose-6-phosphate isomerase-like protein (cupin superfamily)